MSPGVKTSHSIHLQSSRQRTSADAANSGVNAGLIVMLQGD